ncbi:DsbA family protein [Pseudonocardia sp. ICBG1142]|uniref:DsbA family protein n=1 Tax=Pseudonocardia sp. ICBG1142 TaxID=2846760 RepID=UPI002104D74E|nr:DsbA family protein [Pseudonocardia sp. ICBG1142]
MKVEIWSEVTCPWCGLGNHRVARAVERFEHSDEVDLVHHSFPLSGSFRRGAPSPSVRPCSASTVSAATGPRPRPGGSRSSPRARA